MSTNPLILPGHDSSGSAHEVVEVYPSEISAVKMLLADIQRSYGFKTFDRANDRKFTDEVTSRFAELGFVVAIDWNEVDVDDHSDKLYFIPTIALVGRTEKVVIDHERMAREIQSGEMDGREGVIRQDGTLGDATRTNL